MKLIRTNLLRRSRSDPIPASSTSSPCVSDSMIVVDLARREALAALRILRDTSDLRQKVKSAVINADSCIWYGEIHLDSVALVEAFRVLAELPCLQLVTVELNDLKVPVAALTALVKGAKLLRELHLINVHLMGPTDDLDHALQGHGRLSHVRFMQCSGIAIQSFMVHLPALKKLELRYSKVARVANTHAKDPWAALGKSTTLESLTLQELTQMETDHALAYVEALTEQQLLGNSKLMELHMTTNGTTAVDGQLVGQAMADLFLLHPSKITIRTLTLKFGRTWTTAGATVASILLLNPGLTSICVELTGMDSTSAQAIAIFKALRNNTNVRRLKLCLDRDMDLDEPLDDSFERALEELLLQHNHVLHSVRVLDENRDRYRLSEAILHKMELNASKLPALLHTNTMTKTTRTTTSSNQNQCDYINALIEAKENINVLFYAISNQPNLLLDACLDPRSNSSKNRSAASTSKHKILDLFYV